MRPYPGGKNNTMPHVGRYTKALEAKYGNSAVVALAHTHFNNMLNFSGNDVLHVVPIRPFYLYNKAGQLRYLDEGIVNKTLMMSGIIGTNRLTHYLNYNRGMAGECIYGCN